ncbi:hypothetical protein AVEN_196578-1 [Araneus ventricosus]|uniref:Uncharacterized protein n=1 Tax=Araneus ventricosus TaxID=182803 RepID=A0A4Y2SHW9_ARAVE|nr:hypothetical protein AVEN_31088-1 [Araneus ventricosus]GBN87969.1 hypothetical protein AVEN_196578-1 [Araneus ventricosus]
MLSQLIFTIHQIDIHHRSLVHKNTETFTTVFVHEAHGQEMVNARRNQTSRKDHNHSHRPDARRNQCEEVRPEGIDPIGSHVETIVCL